jgi:hypothetical protein
MGWTSLKNGELLREASRDFDIFLTVDRNLSFQQNVLTLPITVAVLAAKTNRLDDLLPLVPKLLARLDELTPGVVLIIE